MPSRQCVVWGVVAATTPPDAAAIARRPSQIGRRALVRSHPGQPVASITAIGVISPSGISPAITSERVPEKALTDAPFNSSNFPGSMLIIL